MDQELRAYLEEMKTSIVKQATGLEDLKASMEERFAQQDARMEERFAQQDKRFEQVEATTYKTQVLLEAMNDKVKLVAEGVTGVSERLKAFQADTARRFEEIQSELKPYYRNVNGRLSHLEDEVPALERRVTALETRPSRRAGKKPPTQ
jgi:predicted  nucleic acid-binding Zn-ribbon protein